MTTEENLYLALLCKFTAGIGNIKGREILTNPSKKEYLLNNSDKVKPLVEKELFYIRKHNIKVTTILDIDYPDSLRNIHNAPLVLYYYGILPQGFCFSVVGTRKPSKYGITTTQMIVSQLCEYNIPIVSGFAYGVDTVAHQTALENQSPTIAVLGTGIDVMYPAANTWMRKRIIDSGGCIMTEFSLGSAARPSNFPTRNRIISGLSQGILIVEAAIGSGSLITAELGLEQGKNIFTIPGTLFGGSFQGNHALIRLGAVLVENGYQILDEFPEYQNHLSDKERKFKTPHFHKMKEENEARKEKAKKNIQSNNQLKQQKTKDVNYNIDEINSDSMSTFLGEQLLQNTYLDKIISELNQDEIIVYQCLEKPIALEVIMSKTRFNAPKTLSVLTVLILKGIISEKGGLYFKS